LLLIEGVFPMGLTITLPESLKAFVEAEVAAGGHADATGYIQDLLLKESRKHKGREKVEALLEEGINSGESTEWTSQDWEFIRREVQQRLAKKNGSIP
jgi:antitoxin ParD1/3/4